MKQHSYSILIGFILFFLWNPVAAYAQQVYRIFNAQGEQVSFLDLMKETQHKSHVFFGELHNNPIAHYFQLEMAKALHAEFGENLQLGAEMFEADNQLILDEYLQGRIGEKQFEAECKLWPNYQTDYKPVVEFAKAEGLDFIATNIPRRYANAVYHGGLQALMEFSDKAKAYMAPLPISIDTTLSSYQEIQAMSAGHSGGHMLEAQAIKDASMAYFILQHSKPGKVFLHLNGSYHTTKNEGIIAYLQAQIAQEKILSITSVEQDQVDQLEEQNKNLADYILCVDADMTKTH